jgi:hypothetical protein
MHTGALYRFWLSASVSSEPPEMVRNNCSPEVVATEPPSFLSPPARPPPFRCSKADVSEEPGANGSGGDADGATGNDEDRVSSMPPLGKPTILRCGSQLRSESSVEAEVAALS